jgi:hypothetical protein
MDLKPSEKLTDAQLALIHLFNKPMSEEDMAELRTLLVQFLNKKLQQEVDKVFTEKQYSETQFDTWLNDPDT